jgi:5'-nucleotidase
MSDHTLKSRRVRTTLRALLGAAVLLVAVSGPSTSAAQDVSSPGVVNDLSGTRILLTNDDGVQQNAIGIYELRKALCNAGAEVVVVGPWADQSGASMSITFGSSAFRFALDAPDIAPQYAADCGGTGAVFGACRVLTGSPADCTGATTLTPADAVTLGAFFVRDEFGWTDGPDVVISGINRGGNDGLNVNISGTVGAATIASSLGYAAIAVSASSSANPVAAAQWTVGFAGTLRAHDALPADYVLNVNYPSGEPSLALWTSVAQTSPFATGYVRDGLLFTSTFGACVPGPRCGPAAPGTDSAVLASRSISITPVSVDRTVGAGADVDQAQLLVMTGQFDRPQPMTVEGCKSGGWQVRGFQNQGECVSAFEA